MPRGQVGVGVGGGAEGFSEPDCSRNLRPGAQAEVQQPGREGARGQYTTDPLLVSSPWTPGCREVVSTGRAVDPAPVLAAQLTSDLWPTGHLCPGRVPRGHYT